MTQEEVLNNCWSIWAARALPGNSESTQKDHFLSLMQSAVDRATSMSDRFWFAIGEADYTISSTDGNTIVLKGSSNEARDIYSIQRGETNWLYHYPETEFMRLAQADNAATSTTANLKGWIRKPDEDGFPTVQIFPTPASGTVLTYRYLQNNVTLEKFPSQFHDVIVFGILTSLRSDLFRFDYMKRMYEMEQHYKSSRKGGYDPLPPTHIANQLARMNGPLNVG